MTTYRTSVAVLTAIFTLTVGTARAEMKKEWVEYNHGDTKLKAYIAYDGQQTGKRPAIFVVHDVFLARPDTAGGETAIEFTDVARENRLQIRVDDRGAQPVVLTDLRQHLA